MAPKRGKKKVVKKTTKVVRETTVEVVSTTIGSHSQVEALPEFSNSKQEQTSVDTKSIPIEEADEETETQEPDVDIPIEWLESDKIATPPREEANPAGQAQPNKRGKTMATTKGRKRRRMRGEGGEGYKRYVYRVMKQVHPGMAITSGAMTVINNFMEDMFERLAVEASKLNGYSKKQTMTASEIQGAVKLVLPGELGKHALAEGSKAVSNYHNFGSKK